METIRNFNKLTSKIVTLRTLLVILFFIHLFFLFFQILLRDLIIDTTIWRDIVIILICIIWFIYLGSCKTFTIKPVGMDFVIMFFLFYGFINFILNIATGSNFLEAITYFRNHFLPFILYFPASYAFNNEKDQKKFIKYLFFIFVIYVSTPIIESLIKISGISLSWIPWYHYAFINGDRFEQSGGYIKVEDSPIIGLLTFPHYTVVPIISIFALVYPFMFISINKDLITLKSNFKLIKFSFLKYFYIMLLCITMLLFQVRTHIISFFIVLFIFAPTQISKSKFIINACVLFFLVFLLISFLPVNSNIIQQFINGFISQNGNDTSLSVLLSLNDVRFVLNSSLAKLLFGNGYNVVSGTTFDLVANSTGWEIKLIFYTAIYGLLWLILIISICLLVFYYSKKSLKYFSVNSFEYNFAIGFKVMMIVLLIDACHYMRLMSWPTLDMWIICLSILSVNYKKINTCRQ